MKHLLSILVLLSLISTANAVTINRTLCYDLYGHKWNEETRKCDDLTKIKRKINCESMGGLYDEESQMCDPYAGTKSKPLNLPKIDLSDIGSGIDISPARTPDEIQNNTILIVSLIFGILIIYLLVSASVKKTKEVYKSSTIPLKNKVKRKELETRFNELDEVKPAEHTYKKTAYVDDTEEINEVKKLERQIKIKKLQKELKDLEEE